MGVDLHLLIPLYLTSNLEGSNFSGFAKISGSWWIETTSRFTDQPFSILYPNKSFGAILDSFIIKT